MAAIVNLDGSDAPKGNWVARNLRLKNDTSNELFPRTPADVKPTKFHSMYKIDYHDFPSDVLLDGIRHKGQQPARETIRDVLFGQSPTALFANWKIPKRISGECEDAKIGDHIGSVPPPRVETPKILRQPTLPSIATSREVGPTRLTPKPRVSLSASHSLRQPQAIRRAKTSMADMPSSRSQAARDHLKARTGLWQQKLPDVDARLLEKVLRLQDQEKGSMRQSLRGTLLPDARRTVDRWLESASEPERQVALQFFHSLVGGRLMGANGVDQSDRPKDVIAALQSPGDRAVAERGLSPRGGAFARDDQGEGRRGLQYVRLLDDNTRRQRWMHTTWHHLPNYRDANPVNNSSSIYIQPHQPQHRHFVIHPDWPPQKQN
ncbi:uncharacterized protein [Littorina saxatilis]|uniref:uncharacterized protein n=1 Tax=Littorina saxatilis TaxID=31220 RepID=UPI0038B68226